MAQVFYSSDSVYRATKIKESKYLDIMQSSITDKADINTKSFEITSKYDLKPDKLAQDLYGNSKLWWVFAEFNPDLLKDPIMDFRAGIEIQVPDSFS